MRIIIALSLAALLTFGCAFFNKKYNDGTGDGRSETTEQVEETPVATDDPAFGITFSEFTQSEMKIEFPYGATLLYVELTDNNWEYPLYVFMDKEGMMQYRAYVSRDVMENGIVIGQESGFVPVIFEDDGQNMENPPHYTLDIETGIVDDSDNLYDGFYKDLCYPKNEDGTPAKGAIPVMAVIDEETGFKKYYNVLPNGYKIFVYDEEKDVEDNNENIEENGKNDDDSQSTTTKPSGTPSVTASASPNSTSTTNPTSSASASPATEQTPGATNTAQPTATPTSTPPSRTVYVSGNIIHSIYNCGEMTSYIAMPLTEALSKGYTMCKKCWSGNTSTPTPTPTQVPSATPEATQTASPSATTSATPEPEQTSSPTSTATSTPTATPTSSPTASPTASPTQSPTATPTATPIATPAASPTASPTATPTTSPTVTPTPTPTATPIPTPTNTHTPSPTATPKPTATVTPKPTATPTPCPTATPTPKPTSTPTPKPTATPTPKPTATATPKPTSSTGHYEQRWIIDIPAVTHSEWVCNGCGHHSMSSSENNAHQKAHAMNFEPAGWHVIVVVDVEEQGHWEIVWVPDP